MSEPRTYTTRPRTVQAMQVQRDTLKALEEWAHVRTELANLSGPGRGLTAGVTVRSRDGKVRAAFGDYLVLPLEVIGKADFEARFQAEGEDQGDAQKVTDGRGRPLPTIWGVGAPNRGEAPSQTQGGTPDDDTPHPQE